MRRTVFPWAWRHGLERVTRNRWGDGLYARYAFRERMGFEPDIAHPKTFSEHMLRLKLSPDLLAPLRVQTTDKEFLRTYVRSTLSDAYNVPALAILRSRKESAAFAYPARCIVKPSHSSGKRIFRQDGEAIDLSVIAGWFSHNYYHQSREANYRDLIPKVIVEEPLSFDGAWPADHKIHCFAGRPKIVHVMSNRLAGPAAASLYSEDWERLPFAIQAPEGPDIPRPANLDAVLDAARHLSAPFSYVRVDLYTDGRRVLVGELTHVPAGAHLRFSPKAADTLMGRLCENPDLDVAALFSPLRK